MKNGIQNAKNKVFFCIFFLFIFAFQAQTSVALSQDTGEKYSELDAKIKLCFGYDNNVSDHIKDKIKSRFLQLYINSNINSLPTEQTSFSLKLQNGFKYLDDPSLSNESIFINNVHFFLSQRVLGKIFPEATGEIMTRTSVHSKSDVLPTEEAYLRGTGGLALRIPIYRDLSGRAFYNYKAINFEDFDQFDRYGYESGLKVDLRLLPCSTLSLQYQREETRFNKWIETSRKDSTDDLILFLHIYKYFLIDITLSHQNNRSNIKEYSYAENAFALLLAKSLPQDTMLQLYILTRFRERRSPSSDTDSAQIDLEDDDRGMITLRISKDINENCDLETQLDLRRNRSREENGLYTKGVFSFSLSFNF